jgi:hypothetical protein
LKNKSIEEKCLRRLGDYFSPTFKNYTLKIVLQSKNDLPQEESRARELVLLEVFSRDKMHAVVLTNKLRRPVFKGGIVQGFLKAKKEKTAVLLNFLFFRCSIPCELNLE